MPTENLDTQAAVPVCPITHFDVTRRCPACEAEFVPKNKRQVSCGKNACRQALHRKNSPAYARVQALKTYLRAEARLQKQFKKETQLRGRLGKFVFCAQFNGLEVQHG